jgi:drug/metabolite transporter (DMT)-like permease
VVYVVVIVLSALFLAEPITAFKLIGMACICTGVVFIGLA